MSDSPTGPLLVIGGSGLLGRELLKQARATWGDGDQPVHATFLDADLAGTDPEWPIWHRLDLRRPHAVEAIIEDLEPAAVINAAYVQHDREPGDVRAITADAPARIAAACADTNARFVQMSSDLVFAGRADQEGGPHGYRESDPTGPVSDYGRAKRDAEEAVAAADPGAAIVRTSLLWDAMGDGGPQIQLLRQPDVAFYTNEFRNPIRVDRLASAVLEIAQRTDITGPIHAAGEQRVDRLTLAQALAPRAGVAADDLRGEPSTDAERASDCALDSSLAREILTAALPGIETDRP